MAAEATLRALLQWAPARRPSPRALEAAALTCVLPAEAQDAVCRQLSEVPTVDAAYLRGAVKFLIDLLEVQRVDDDCDAVCDALYALLGRLMTSGRADTAAPSAVPGSAGPAGGHASYFLNDCAYATGPPVSPPRPVSVYRSSLFSDIAATIWPATWDLLDALVYLPRVTTTAAGGMGSLMPLFRGRKVLELGAGTGLATMLLARAWGHRGGCSSGSGAAPAAPTTAAAAAVPVSTSLFRGITMTDGVVEAVRHLAASVRLNADASASARTATLDASDVGGAAAVAAADSGGASGDGDWLLVDGLPVACKVLRWEDVSMISGGSGGRSSPIDTSGATAAAAADHDLDAAADADAAATRATLASMFGGGRRTAHVGEGLAAFPKSGGAASGEDDDDLSSMLALLGMPVGAPSGGRGGGGGCGDDAAGIGGTIEAFAAHAITLAPSAHPTVVAASAAAAAEERSARAAAAAAVASLSIGGGELSGYDLVIGSDLVYDPADVPALVGALAALLAPPPLPPLPPSAGSAPASAAPLEVARPLASAAIDAAVSDELAAIVTAAANAASATAPPQRLALLATSIRNPSTYALFGRRLRQAGLCQVDLTPLVHAARAAAGGPAVTIYSSLWEPLLGREVGGAPDASGSTDVRVALIFAKPKAAADAGA